jgi:hypothetical protein
MAAPFKLEGTELPQPIYPYRNFLQSENHRMVQDH